MSYPKTIHVSRPRSRAGLVLGLGLGGFADGIALHQITQWHNLGSARLPPTTMEAMRRNMAWDGWFHVATLLLTLAGVYLLLRDARARVPLPTSGGFTGQLLLGWGVFNLVEGIVDHHLLGLHHVRETGNETAWDLAFLAFGAALAAGGLLLAPGRADRTTCRNEGSRRPTAGCSSTAPGGAPSRRPRAARPCRGRRTSGRARPPG